MEDYTTPRKDKIKQLNTTWMALDDTMLSELVERKGLIQNDLSYMGF